MPEVTLTMIAAVAEGNVIGRDGAMPWHLPTDFRFYKATTMGKPLVMGRKTFQSIGRPLPGRANIVVTHDPDFAHEGVSVFGSLEEALAFAATLAGESGSGEVFVNGGGAVYEQAMARAQRLYITHVQAHLEGDTYFPAIDPAEWTVTDITGYSPGPSDTHPFVIRRYDRSRAPGFD